MQRGKKWEDWVGEGAGGEGREREGGVEEPGSGTVAAAVVRLPVP